MGQIYGETYVGTARLALVAMLKGFILTRFEERLPGWAGAMEECVPLATFHG